MKRLKNIEDKNEEQLKAIKGKTDIKSRIDLFNENLSSKAVALLQETKDVGDNIFTGGNKDVYVLKNFKTLEKLIKDICDENTTID